MTTTIAIKPPRAVRIRRLKASHPYLNVGDIVKMTGYPPSIIKEALAARGRS